jgi:aminoglycoside phosphotransferase (APT) family kinase protein
MNENNYLDAAVAFANFRQDLPAVTANELSATPMAGGLINNSWKVSNSHTAPFLLQQINNTVFQSPIDVQQNYINIWEYAKKHSHTLRLPAPLYYRNSQTLYQDKQGNYWRAFEFIEDSTSKIIAQNPEQAKTTAKTFASFTASFAQFDLAALKVVIPEFHNLSHRYKQFEESLQQNKAGRLDIAREVVYALKARKRYKDFYDHITHSPEKFPVRVMHHDAKIANVLFGKKTNKVICTVDFDTVMPGYYFSDLGDMIRSMACSEDENCTEPGRLEIRPEFYDAIVSGYTEVMRQHLTKEEKAHIHYAGILMIYMQALRFITDYLNGDIYYRILYPTQNFDRAVNQLTLLHKLEDFLEDHYQFNPHDSLPEK